MKPLGCSININEKSKIPSLIINHPSKTEDKIWEAVECAILEGWKPKQFKNEVISAWEEYLSDQIKYMRKDLE